MFWRMAVPVGSSVRAGSRVVGSAWIATRSVGSFWATDGPVPRSAVTARLVRMPTVTGCRMSWAPSVSPGHGRPRRRQRRCPQPLGGRDEIRHDRLHDDLALLLAGQGRVPVDAAGRVAGARVPM